MFEAVSITFFPFNPRPSPTNLTFIVLLQECILDRCDFHNEKETKYCSLGVCNIYTFVMSETLCPLYGISLTSAHLPKLVVQGVVTSIKPKTQSEELARDSEEEDEESDTDQDGWSRLLEVQTFFFLSGCCIIRVSP